MASHPFICQWRRGLRIRHRAHYEAAKHDEIWHRILVIPTVVISALLGTSVFTDVLSSGSYWLKYVSLVLSVTMIALSSVQTFLRYAERSEKHKTVAVQIGELRRELEQSLDSSGTGEIDKETADRLRKKWDDIDRQAPLIPTRIFERVQADVNKEEKDECGRGSK